MNAFNLLLPQTWYAGMLPIPENPTLLERRRSANCANSLVDLSFFLDLEPRYQDELEEAIMTWSFPEDSLNLPDICVH